MLNRVHGGSCHGTTVRPDRARNRAASPKGNRRTPRYGVGVAEHLPVEQEPGDRILVGFGRAAAQRCDHRGDERGVVPEHRGGSELAEVEGMQAERVVHSRARPIRTDRDESRTVRPVAPSIPPATPTGARRPPGGETLLRRSVASRSEARRARRCRPRPCAPSVARIRPCSSSPTRTSPLDERQWTWSCGSNGTLGGAGSESNPMVPSSIVGVPRDATTTNRCMDYLVSPTPAASSMSLSTCSTRRSQECGPARRRRAPGVPRERVLDRVEEAVGALGDGDQLASSPRLAIGVDTTGTPAEQYTNAFSGFIDRVISLSRCGMSATSKCRMNRSASS